MVNNNVKDFDSFFKEAEQEPIKFKLFGKIEEMPPSLPAIILVKLNKAKKQYKNKDLPYEVNMDLSVELFGEKRVEQWCRKGLTVEQLEELIKWAMEQYNPQQAKAEAEMESDGKSKKKQ